MKYCPKCDENLTEDKFNKNDNKYDGLCSYCRICLKKYNDQYYQENKERIKRKNKKRRQKLSEWLRRYKNFLSCEECGFDKHPVALDFHHKEQENKFKCVSVMVAECYGIERVKKEIRKCLVLCKNCHTIKHNS